MGANCLALTRCSTKEPHSAASSRKNRVRRGRKAQTLRVPPGKILKAQAMLIEGRSQREIGRTLRMSGHRVAKVVRTADFQQFIQEQRERLFAIAPDALESFHAQVKMDGHLAYVFMKDLGIIPSREALVTLMDPAPPEFATGYDRQAWLVANVLPEGHANLGVDLPPQVEEALARDLKSQESKTSPAKLARR
jgi:hypothetical protein